MPTSAYRHSSARGPLWIVRKANAKWYVLADSHTEGPFETQHDAAAQAARGIYWPSFGSTADLAISAFISDWESVG